MTVIDFSAERARRRLEQHFNPTLVRDIIDLFIVYACAFAAIVAFAWII